MHLEGALWKESYPMRTECTDDTSLRTIRQELLPRSKRW
jgi:hypothetical protein